MKNALIITDRQNLAQDLRTELESQNWQTVVSNSVSPAQKLLQKTPFRLVVLDGEHLSKGGIQLESPSSDNGFLLLVQNPDNHQIPSDLSPDALKWGIGYSFLGVVAIVAIAGLLRLRSLPQSRLLAKGKG